ncbi:IS3 family transposase [Streptomyces sp. bgisy029]|uniref:IS3 family transposase n=1 Tax=Streptomyces sp. bgisy029 TaxID=3413771 RepID=UPI003D70F6F1
MRGSLRGHGRPGIRSPAAARRLQSPSRCSHQGQVAGGIRIGRRPPPLRQAAEARLATRIRAVHQESDGTYGAPRITVELRETNGEAVNHERVAR